MTIIKPNNMTYHYQPPLQKQKHDISTFGYGLGMGLRWVHISPLPVPYPYYEIEENPVKLGKTRHIGVGLDGYPWARVLLACLILKEYWESIFDMNIHLL